MHDVRFLHIPKTAGSTFANILISRYGLHRSFQFIGRLEEDRKRWDRLPGPVRDRTALFLCHSPLVTGIDKADRAGIITFLRDPFTRVKSFCQHVYEGKSPYLRHKFPPFAFSAADILASGELELDNLQTSVLAGYAGGGRPVGPRPENPGQLLDRAWQTLSRDLLCFGLLEQFDPSILLFARKLGWTQTPWYVRVNRHSRSRKLEFTDRDLERIRDLNRLDSELYQRAQVLFRQRLDEAGLNSEIVQRFRRANRGRTVYTALKWLPIRLQLKWQRLALGSS